MTGLKDLLLGANETTFINIEGFTEPFEVRKLNIKEERKYRRIINKSMGKVSTTERNGFRNSGQEAKAELDIAVTSDAEYDANIYLIKQSCKINGESFDDVDIETQMDAEVFNKLVKALKELNNLDNSRNTEEEIKKP